MMSPPGSEWGGLSLEIGRELGNWNRNHRLGRTFDSSTGFTLPDQSVFSPDASWVSMDRWNQLSKEERSRFAPVCPEFIVELRSPSDSLGDLKAKMENWMKNGVKLA